MLRFEVLVRIIHFYFLVSNAWTYTLQRKAAFLSFILAAFLYDNRINHRKSKWACCHNDDAFLNTNPLGFRLVVRGAPQMLERARHFHRYSRMFAAIPTQCSLLAFNVSSKSTITCLSASDAGSDFCCRNMGSLTICLIIIPIPIAIMKSSPLYFSNQQAIILQSCYHLF